MDRSPGPEADARLQRVTELLRELRHRLTRDPELSFEQWEIQLYAYDEALVTAADIVDVPVPPAARDEMGPAERSALEQALADAGLDVWSED